MDMIKRTITGKGVNSDGLAVRLMCETYFAPSDPFADPLYWIEGERKDGSTYSIFHTKCPTEARENFEAATATAAEI